MSAALRRGFDRLAPVYDLLLRLSTGRLIPNSQTALLEHLPPGERALLVGGGTGEFLAALAKSERYRRITNL